MAKRTTITANEAVRELVLEAKEARGCGQRELAELVGMSQSNLSKFLGDSENGITLDSAEWIAMGLAPAGNLLDFLLSHPKYARSSLYKQVAAVHEQVGDREFRSLLRCLKKAARLERIPDVARAIEAVL